MHNKSFSFSSKNGLAEAELYQRIFFRERWGLFTKGILQGGGG